MYDVTCRLDDVDVWEDTDTPPCPEERIAASELERLNTELDEMAAAGMLEETAWEV